MNFIMIYPFTRKNKNEKVEKIVANLHDKTECVIHKKFKTGIKSWISFLKSS